MDLVDIDQVLDNLELSVAADERERAKTISVQASSRPAVHTAPASAVSGGDIAVSPTEARILGDGATSRSGSKNFVGVSQVFNSLDDYRNNVKSLETTATQAYDWKQKDEEEAVSTTVNVNKEEIVNERILKTDVVANCSDDNLEDDDELGNSTDIHKFKERNGVLRTSTIGGDASEPAVSTPESLTTSSCSTFSSGPSPGNASNTEEISTPPPSPDESAREVLTKPQEVPKPTCKETNLNESENACAVLDNKKSMLEDLAVGLSSISITTDSQSILPCEVTASSALGKVLNELSETEEITSQSAIPQSTKEFAVTDSEVCVVTEESKRAPEVVAEPLKSRNIDIRNKIAAKQPITFCSTMDDISDAELDSMLQEIDVDDVAEQTSHRILSKITQEQTNEIHTVPVSTLDETVEVTSEPETSQSGDHINADNFSQASTVEFAEIKVEAAEDPIDREAEEATSSYTSTDSESMSEKKGNEEIVNCDEDTQQRPARPNTLDVTAYNSQMYSNAGQTPPGVEETGEGQLSESKADVGEQFDGTNQEELVATNEDDSESISEAVGYSDPHANLGKVPPIWVPDNMAAGCMQCQQKFTMIKRRHHCRACGKVLCSVCCSQKIKLEFLPDPESRVCVQCFLILTERHDAQLGGTNNCCDNDDIANAREDQLQNLPPTPMRSPNPNNPMEYCSTIPPHRQVNAVTSAPPPSVIVPVGVLKKDGSYSSNSSSSSGQKVRKRKSVMFSDGIAPGSELASSMEQQWADAKQARRGHQSDKNKINTNNKPSTPASNETRSMDSTTMGLMAQLFRGSIPPSAAAATVAAVQSASEREKESKARTNNSPRRKVDTQRSKKLPSGSDPQGCFIPYEENALPPICMPSRENTSCDYDYKEVKNDFDLVERLKKETLKFMIRNNFYVYVKIVNLNCCMNRTVINFTTCGMHHVGNDEIIILLEYKPVAKREEFLEPGIPKDIFSHLHEIYCESEHGRPIAELSYTSPRNSSFLNSREYGGFIYIRASYQCLQEVILPENPYLVGVLIHRHEIPWAKIFPLRLVLRLGAQYRYYPCPLISIRNRESVYAEIAQTIINFLADFRNYSYTLPTIRGMYIHMEDRQTTVLIPRNRQEDVNKAINNASDHILAFGGNFSKTADGHLVCMQNVNDDQTELYAYSTQAINIQGHPRKVTGASFFVLNESLKTTSGLSGKCSIVEDGLMVQILPAKMEEVRNALRNQTDVDIVCGPVEPNEQQSETVSIKWVENDRDFNIGVKSPIDEKSMEGISSMRVHASFNYSNDNYSIRLTDIYILKFDDWYNATQATLATSSSDITRISEQIARSASMALIPFLDLLAAAGITKLALRATLDQENVCYEAGARGAKLPPLYMNALDNHLIPTLHNESTGIDEAIVLELVFYILNV